MELNREQIVKALECCSKDDCDKCPNSFGNCYSNLAGYSLALIREQAEENERLKAGMIDYRNIPYIIAEAKAATVRRMQERLHEKAEIVSTYGNPTMVDLDDINQIAQEILEEKV